MRISDWSSDVCSSDLQEDKPPLCDTVDTVSACLAVYAEMIPAIEVRRDNCRAAAARGFSTATDLADYLVNKGLPFRDAHHVVGSKSEEHTYELPSLMRRSHAVF